MLAKETMMKATALNKLMSSKTPMYSIHRLEFRKSVARDVIVWDNDRKTMAINCPTKILTINGSLPDLLRGMSNLRSVWCSSSIELECRPSRKLIPSTMEENTIYKYPETATVMYDSVACEDITPPQYNIGDISLNCAVSDKDGDYYQAELAIFNRQTCHQSWLYFELLKKDDTCKPSIKIVKNKGAISIKINNKKQFVSIYFNLIWPDMLNVIIDKGSKIETLSYYINDVIALHINPEKDLLVGSKNS